MTTVVTIVVILLVLFFVFKSNNAKKTLNEISKFDDFTITENEKRTANLLYQITQAVQENPDFKYLPELNYKAAINELALNVFKSGMWRLNDLKLANQYFTNPGYIQISKEKFIDDVNLKVDQNYFQNKSNLDIEKYVLDWVMKFKTDAQQIETFLS